MFNQCLANNIFNNLLNTALGDLLPDIAAPCQPAPVVELPGIIWRSYGSYHPVAVARETRSLLQRLEAEQNTLDYMDRLPKLQQQVAALLKKYQNLQLQVPVHGCYNSRLCRVELYPAALQLTSSQLGLDYNAYRSSVLVHEQVHYLHYQQLLQQYNALQAAPTSKEWQAAQAYWHGGNTSIAATVVKEVLAEYARYVYASSQLCNAADSATAGSNEQGQTAADTFILQELQAVATALKNSFTGPRAHYPSWPYAGVQVLLGLPKPQAAQLYRQLWQLSLTSWDRAYGLLRCADAGGRQ